MSFIDVEFHRLAPNPSVEAAIYRWVARFETMRIEVLHATLSLEPSGQRTVANLTLTLPDGSVRTSTAAQEDVYVSVANAFRAVRRQILDAANPMRMRRYAFA